MQSNAPTIQQVLGEAVFHILGQKTILTGCGRTDAGVHARQFYVHADLQHISPEDTRDVVYRLNRYLPEDIVIYELLAVDARAHARFDAISRTYEYVIIREKNPFLPGLAYCLFDPLDIGAMNLGADILMEYEDFTSFSKVHTQVKTNICAIRKAAWKESGDMLVFTITADRFLRNMVRAVVGTLINIGRRKTTLDELRRIIEAKDRSKAGFSAPARGLYLTFVEYPSGIFEENQVKRNSFQ